MPFTASSPIACKYRRQAGTWPISCVIVHDAELGRNKYGEQQESITKRANMSPASVECSSSCLVAINRPNYRFSSENLLALRVCCTLIVLGFGLPSMTNEYRRELIRVMARIKQLAADAEA